MRRLKVIGASAAYHVMSRSVSGTPYFDDRAKEMLRKMIWQAADFSGVEVLTYCVMSNHFHVLVRVPVQNRISDTELLRRYRVLYPKPTKYRTASIQAMEQSLAEDGEEASEIRRSLLARMGDVSEYMKTLKQRFSVWYNRTHGRVGTLWSERFKSVLVEGRGNPLQTIAAYIDLNPVRAGLVTDPVDYRYCGYAEAVAGQAFGRRGLQDIWGAYADGSARERLSPEAALRMHRELIFGCRAADAGLPDQERERALKVLQPGGSTLPKATALRRRVRYFTDGAILGTQDYVRSFIPLWQKAKKRKSPPKAHLLCGAEWSGSGTSPGQNLACIRGLRTAVFR
ncbi:MAG: transposase [Opitutales bacterium]